MNITNTTATLRRNAPGTFATGKGTTAAIKVFFAERDFPHSVAEVASEIGKPARQLNKRFSELVASGYLKKTGKYNGKQEFISSASPRVDYVL